MRPRQVPRSVPRDVVKLLSGSCNTSSAPTGVRHLVLSTKALPYKALHSTRTRWARKGAGVLKHRAG